jgi:hypothetical protein
MVHVVKITRRITMTRKLTVAVGVMAVFVLAGTASANLLTNGSLELPGDGNTATGWTAEGVGGGWANTEQAGWGSGNWHFAFGHWGAGGGGWANQTVAASAGTAYQLSVDSGADAWFLPTGRMSMIFLDASGSNVVGSATRLTVDPAVYGVNDGSLVELDIPHPWANYTLNAVAPAGTALVMVQFESNETSWDTYINGDPNASGATGSVGFDNAVLEVVPEPATLGLLGLSGLLLWIRRRMS